MNFITFRIFVFISCTFRIINSNNHGEYNYEKMNRYGPGRRLIPNYRRLNPNMDFGYGGEHPATLPEPSKGPYVPSPYHAIAQGKRKKGDYRAYLDSFHYSPLMEKGQRYYCEARLNCIISYLTVRTDKGVPILLRGGVGYRHFYVIARGYAGNQLNGSVAVYCMRQNSEARRYQYGLLGREGEYFF